MSSIVVGSKFNSGDSEDSDSENAKKGHGHGRMRDSKEKGHTSTKNDRNYPQLHESSSPQRYPNKKVNKKKSNKNLSTNGLRVSKGKSITNVVHDQTQKV